MKAKKAKDRHGPKLIEENISTLKKSKHPHLYCGGDVYFTDKWFETKRGERFTLRWCVKCRGYYVGKKKSHV